MELYDKEEIAKFIVIHRVDFVSSPVRFSVLSLPRHGHYTPSLPISSIIAIAQC